MPYALKKKRGHDLYWVVNTITKHKYSKEALPLEQAKAQMRALYANTRNETKGGRTMVAAAPPPPPPPPRKKGLANLAHYSIRAPRSKKDLPNMRMANSREVGVDIGDGSVEGTGNRITYRQLIDGIYLLLDITRERITPERLEEINTEFRILNRLNEPFLQSVGFRDFDRPIEVLRWIFGINPNAEGMQRINNPRSVLASSVRMLAYTLPERLIEIQGPLREPPRAPPEDDNRTASSEVEEDSVVDQQEINEGALADMMEEGEEEEVNDDDVEYHPTGGAVTHREKVLRRYSLKEGQSLAKLSKVSGISKSVLQEVYNRGIGAYKTNPRSVRKKVTFKKGVNAPMSQKLSKEQWAMARVYSFLDNNPKHDTDLR